MEVKPGYKQTEAGVIPEDWSVQPLAGLISISHGFGFQGQFFAASGNYRLTTPGHFYEHGGFRDLGEKQKFYLGPIPDGYLLNKGDLIVAMTEQADGLLGSTAFIPVDGTYLHNQRLGKIKVLSPRVNARFLYRILNSTAYRAKVRETSAGTKVRHTSPSRLLDIAVPLPPTNSEQGAIDQSLTDADALIESLERLMEKKRQIKQGAMEELLAGTRRLPGFIAPWSYQPIAEIATPHSEKNSAHESFPVLACSKHVGFIDSLRFFKNQVFSDDTSGYKIIKKWEIGFPANHVEEGSIGLQDLYDVALVSPIYVVLSVRENINSYFLHRLLKLDSYRHKFKAATASSVDRRGSLRWPAFSQIHVNIPGIAEQNAIADILRHMEGEIVALEAELTKMRELKQGMMQELLTGRIRLV